jgi:hypothetical protein
MVSRLGAEGAIFGAETRFGIDDGTQNGFFLPSHFFDFMGAE